MFVSTVIDDRYIYVYGGTQSSASERPTLTTNIFERYDSSANIWSNIVIEGAPNLSAFGWSEGATSSELFILGGSDGSILNESLYKIDFKQGKAVNLGVEYEF
jgi:N-acetylneuraminic acid mutarotase